MKIFKIIIKTFFRALFYAIATIILSAIVLLIVSFITESDTVGQIILVACGISVIITIIIAIIKGIREFKLIHITKLISLLCKEKDGENRHNIIDLINNDLKIFGKNSQADTCKKEAHQKFLAEIIYDGKITGEEKETLTYLENTLELDLSTIRKNRREAYMIAYNWATKDRVLSEDEE